MCQPGHSIPIESLVDGSYQVIAIGFVRFAIHYEGDLKGTPTKGVFVLRPHETNDCITVHFDTATVLPQVNTDVSSRCFPVELRATLTDSYVNFTKSGENVEITDAGKTRLAAFSI